MIYTKQQWNSIQKILNFVHDQTPTVQRGVTFLLTGTTSVRHVRPVRAAAKRRTRSSISRSSRSRRAANLAMSS